MVFKSNMHVILIKLLIECGLLKYFYLPLYFFLPLICIRFNLDRTFYFVLSPAYLPLPCILPIISAVLAFVDVWVVSFARVQFIVRE